MAITMCKIQQGNSFDNLKHFIYLTNEYGVPSLTYLDDFINQFGADIINGRFRFNDWVYTKLDIFWEEVKKGCLNSGVGSLYSKGSVFYKVIANEAMTLLKSNESYNWEELKIDEKVELLREIIKNFYSYKWTTIEQQSDESSEQIDDDKQSVTEEDNTDKKLEDTEKNIEEVVVEDIEEIWMEQERNIFKRYILKESSSGRIGKVLNYEGKPFCTIASPTSIDVDGTLYDIGEYIANNKLDTSKILFGTKIWFRTLYQEIIEE